MNSHFDFAGAGYDGPGDWARLHDLLPVDISKAERKKLEASDTKDLVCEILRSHGVQFDRAYDPEAAPRRNT